MANIFITDSYIIRQGGKRMGGTDMKASRIALFTLMGLTVLLGSALSAPLASAQGVAPNAPENLLPSARQTSTSVTISALATDNDGDRMNVFFYDNLAQSVTLSDPTEDGYIDYDGSETYERDSTGMTIFISGRNDQRGYVGWDVSSISDSIIITKVVFKYHGDYYEADAHVHAMANQPSVSDNSVVYNDAGDGTVYDTPAGFPTEGQNKEADLGSSAVSDLQNQLSSDWFAIGIDMSDGSDACDIRSEEAPATPNPTLYIEYALDNVWVDNGGTASVVWSDLTRGQTYTFFAGAQDNNGNWGDNSATQTFTVNSLPVATIDAPPDGYGIGEGEGIAFEGSATDAEGDTCTYSWDFGDGTTSTNENQDHTYGSSGSYTVTLTANDGYEDGVPTSITVSVGGGAAPPPGGGPGGPGGFVEQVAEEIEKVVQPAKNPLFTFQIVGVPIFFPLLLIGAFTWFHKDRKGIHTMKGISYSIWMGVGFLLVMGAQLPVS